jgi:hypothetical protein
MLFAKHLCGSVIAAINEAKITPSAGLPDRRRRPQSGEFILL